jgi:thiamine-phosphate pyrophosphorylase
MIELPRLLVVTDRSQLPRRRNLIDHLTDCLSHGVTHIVLRELDLPDAERAWIAAELADAGASVIAARRRLPRCIGVHLSATSRPIEGTWGRSCHSVHDIDHAAEEGASWVTLSPFAGSPSKRGYGPPLPPSAFAGHPVPVFALGGIDARNARDAVNAGAHGVAVMGAIMRDRHPGRLVSRILEAVS